MQDGQKLQLKISKDSVATTAAESFHVKKFFGGLKNYLFFRYQLSYK